jgi:hypothetical protein
LARSGIIESAFLGAKADHIAQFDQRSASLGGREPAIVIGRVLIAVVGAVFTILVGLHAEAAQPADPVEASGYRQSAEGQALVDTAIKAANAVLSSSSSFKLTPAWNVDRNQAQPANEARVYIVATTPEPFVIQVPFRSCHCIFIQEEAFRRSIDRYARDSKRSSRIDPAHLLAFMLLHEVGHQQSGDPGYMDKESPDLNFDDNEIKVRERTADEFAARALIAAAKDTRRMDAFLSAINLETALTKTSFNLTGIRLVDHFGGSALCSKELFADRGVSHPNFELRILTVNDIISGTATSHDLVAEFERCRIPQRR